MLNSFIQWIRNSEPVFQSKNFRTVFTPPNGDSYKQGAYIDIEGGKTISRITLWNTGECDLESLYFETGKPVIPYQHYIFCTPEEMFDILNKFINLLYATEQ